MRKTSYLMALLCLSYICKAQDIVPLDTLNWDIQARSYVLETYKGQQAIYLQGGSITLKDGTFLNGTIEYDIYLKETQAFPGVYFRINESDAEQFYVRPHQSGNPDANQAVPLTKGISAWQLYFGEKYSFAYDYNFKGWTHVKLVVNNDKAQVYLDHAEKPNLSWQLFHTPKAGKLALTGGNAQAMHLANIKIDRDNYELKDFAPLKRTPIDGAVQAWDLSDKFDEKLLQDPSKLSTVIEARKWGGKQGLDEGVAVNISRAVQRYNDNPGNTVFAKIEITASKAGLKHFDFGYSDRVVVILNGTPIYRGNNRWRSRDYRYLGTIGLFDGVYLDLKKGKNTLLLAVSEDFGGWLVTGKFNNPDGLKIK